MWACLSSNTLIMKFFWSFFQASGGGELRAWLLAETLFSVSESCWRHQGHIKCVCVCVCFISCAFDPAWVGSVPCSFSFRFLASVLLSFPSLLGFICFFLETFALNLTKCFWGFFFGFFKKSLLKVFKSEISILKYLKNAKQNSKIYVQFVNMFVKPWTTWM